MKIWSRISAVFSRTPAGQPTESEAPAPPKDGLSKTIFWPYQAEEEKPVVVPSTPPRSFIPYAPDRMVAEDKPAAQTPALSKTMFWPYPQEAPAAPAKADLVETMFGPSKAVATMSELPTAPPRQFIPIQTSEPSETKSGPAPRFWPYTEAETEAPPSPPRMFWPYNQTETVKAPPAEVSPKTNRLRKLCCGLLVAVSLGGLISMPGASNHMTTPNVVTPTQQTQVKAPPPPAAEKKAPVTVAQPPRFHNPIRYLHPIAPATTITVTATPDEIPVESAPVGDQLILPQEDSITASVTTPDVSAVSNDLTTQIPFDFGVTAPHEEDRGTNNLLEAGSLLPLGGTAVETVTALTDAHMALALGAQAQQLGAEAQAALAAGNIPKAVTLGNEAKQLGGEATRLGSKAQTAANIAKPLSIVGGSVAVVDGTVDMTKGISGIRQANRLQTEVNTEYDSLVNDGTLTQADQQAYDTATQVIHQKHTGAVHRTERGGAKVGFGTMMIVSPFTGPAAPIVGGIGAGGYLVTSVAPHVHPVKWSKAVYHHLPFVHHQQHQVQAR